MTYTTPRTWVAGELVTASIMNTHIRDNMNELNDRLLFKVFDNSGTFTSTSTTETAVDATTSKNATTTGGTVVVVINCVLSNSAGTHTIGVSVDSGAVSQQQFYVSNNANADYRGLCTITAFITGLSATSHSFNLTWKTTAGTVTMSKATIPLTYAAYEV